MTANALHEGCTQIVDHCTGNFCRGHFVRTIRAMKRTLLTTFAAALVAGCRRAVAQATEVGYGRKFGLGFVLGDPTGLSAKFWVAPTNSLDFGLGFWTASTALLPDNDGAGLRQLRPQQRHVQHRLPLAVEPRPRWLSSTGTSVAAAAIWWGGCANNCFAVAARCPSGSTSCSPTRASSRFLRAGAGVLDRPRLRFRHRRRPRRPILFLVDRRRAGFAPPWEGETPPAYRAERASVVVGFDFGEVNLAGALGGDGLGDAARFVDHHRRRLGGGGGVRVGAASA